VNLVPYSKLVRMIRCMANDLKRILFSIKMPNTCVFSGEPESKNLIFYHSRPVNMGGNLLNTSINRYSLIVLNPWYHMRDFLGKTYTVLNTHWCVLPDRFHFIMIIQHETFTKSGRYYHKIERNKRFDAI
jgi:hypothetical protein